MSGEGDLDRARQRLATGQEALMRALAGQADVPVGFDAGRVRLAGSSLVAKRGRAAARAWPALASALEPAFEARFAAFATRNPLPSRGGALADGLAFAKSLPAEEVRGLGDAARTEAMAVTLRNRPVGHDGSLTPRVGASATSGWLRQARRWVLAVRIPAVGERWLALPLGFARR